MKDWLIIIASLADEAAAALLILLILWLLKIPISLPIILLLVVFFAVAVAIMHLLVIPVFHRKITTGREEMVGLEGQVVEALTPGGLIRVKGEYWKAKSVSGNIPAGGRVEIIAFSGLILIVKIKKQSVTLKQSL